MEVYERRMNALRAGEFVPPPDDAYDADADLRALQSAHKRKNVERDTYMSKEQLEELRQVQAERIQVRPRCVAPVRSDFGPAGGQDEAARHGRQAEYGCPYGRHYVRRLRGPRHVAASRKSLSLIHTHCWLVSTPNVLLSLVFRIDRHVLNATQLQVHELISPRDTRGQHAVTCVPQIILRLPLHPHHLLHPLIPPY